MRVLARRDPVDRRGGRLVVGPRRAAATPVVTTKATTRTAVTETHLETSAEHVAVSVAETIAPTVPVTTEAPVLPEAAAAVPVLTAAQRRARREAANRAA